MAEKHTSITPAREEGRAGLSRPQQGWSASPFRMLQTFADEVDRMFDDFGFGRHFARRSTKGTGFEWAPEVEVFQKNNELTIKADLPGLTKDEVSVEVTEDAVIIQGERKREHQEEREGYYRTERSYGTFCRVVPLPAGAIGDQAKAQFRDGVLEVTMPAPPASKGRRLDIR
jgi:HSP20 family protein